MFESEKIIANLKSTSHTASLILQDINAKVSELVCIEEVNL